MPPPTPPLTHYGLRGEVVTLGPEGMIADGTVYVETDTGTIEAVVDNQQGPPPANHADTAVFSVEGTLYPGLIELHNHLCYNILTLWTPPRAFDHRDQWARHSDYLPLIRGPLQTLGVNHAAAYLPALIRYVDAKCLVAGVTSSQGITLKDQARTPTYFRGNVRNVETTGRRDLPNASARIADIDRNGADTFLSNTLNKPSTTAYLLHLSEGFPGNDTALDRFDRLRLESGDGWAINEKLIGIHSSGLRRVEFEILRDHKAGIVWSPLSNLILYGATTDVATAKALGIRIALGSDWSPTGSKNLLGEMKVAWLHSEAQGGIFTPEEIVRMATTTAADLLGWQARVGTLQAGKVADLVAIGRSGGDPYKRLIEATETDVALVVIDGIPRYGRATLLTQIAGRPERRKIGGNWQGFWFETSRPGQEVRVELSLKDAEQALKQGLRNLKDLAEQGRANPLLGMLFGGDFGEDGSPAEFILDLGDDTDAAFFSSAAAAIPYKTVARPVPLDPLTIVDDPHYGQRLAGQGAHVPDYIRHDLIGFYP